MAFFVDLIATIKTLRYYAGWADKIHGKTIPIGKWRALLNPDWLIVLDSDEPLTNGSLFFRWGLFYVHTT